MEDMRNVKVRVLGWLLPDKARTHTRDNARLTCRRQIHSRSRSDTQVVNVDLLFEPYTSRTHLRFAMSDNYQGRGRTLQTI